MKRVFLGGTQSGSKWRDDLIPMLKIGYTSPVETAHSKEIVSEDHEAGLADFILQMITPKSENFEALDIVSRAVQQSNKFHSRVILCVLYKDEDVKFNGRGKKTLRGIMEMVRGNGSQVFDSMDDLATYLNSFYVDPDYEPDMVECLIKREGETVITLGKTRYTFKKNEAGHYVCKVVWKEHREYLVSLADFRLYQKEKAPDPEFTDEELDFMREWKLLGADRFLAYVNANIERFNQSREKIRAIAIEKWKALLPKMACPILLESGQEAKEPDFVDEWIKLDGVKFEEYVIENEGRFMECDEAIRTKARDKWNRLIFAKTAEPCPMVLETNF